MRGYGNVSLVETIVIGSACWAELLCGFLSGSDMALARLVIDRCADFTHEHAVETERLFYCSDCRSSLTDRMMTAVAVLDDPPIATANRNEFERFATARLTIA